MGTGEGLDGAGDISKDRVWPKAAPPGERSAIRLVGRGDGLTTRIIDALTGEDLGARYGIREVTLKSSGDNWTGVTLILELGCPVIAQLSGCWPNEKIKTFD